MQVRNHHLFPAHLGTKNGHLLMDNHDLVELTREHGSPLFVFSERRLLDNASGFLKAAKAGHSKAQVFFASKACSNLHVLRAIRSQGVGIEVNSGGELWKARSVGFAPQEIVFNGVAKTVDELSAAISFGIKTINVESAFELQRIADVSAGLGTKATVALRAVPGIGGGATAGIQTGNATSKFGMTEPELQIAISIALANPKSIDLAGMHMHIGSQVSEISAFETGVEFVAQKAKEIAARLGKPLRQLNLGGGYPIDYAHLASGSNLDEATKLKAFSIQISAAEMVTQVAALAARRFGTDVEIHFEPGRSLVGDAAVLISCVENERMRGAVPWLYLDAGYNLLIDAAAVCWYYHMLNVSRMNAEPDKAFRIVGPLCDSADCFFDVEGEYLWKSVSKNLEHLPPETLAALKRDIIRLPETRNLPSETVAGDFIALLDTGAYSLGEMFQYCGRQRAKAIMISKQDRIVVLRERDRTEDLIDRAEIVVSTSIMGNNSYQN